MLSQLSQAEASWVIGSIGIDLMDSSPWFKFRGLLKMLRKLRQLRQAEASWVMGTLGSIGRDFYQGVCPYIKNRLKRVFTS